MILTGLRGVGKTVLLRELRARVQRAGWLEIHMEAMPDTGGQEAFRTRLGRDLTASLRRYAQHPKTKAMSSRIVELISSVNAFSVSAPGGLGVSIERQLDVGTSGYLETDLLELVEQLTRAVAEQGGAFAMFVDEMQDLDEATMAALIAAQHRAGQEGWPFYLFGAGLPSLPRVLSEVRSYAERLFDYRLIDRLDPVAARLALTQPVHDVGADFTDEALNTLVNAAASYPYFLQEFGKAIWERAAGPVMTEEDANDAIVTGRQQLDRGFFLSRWERATKAERRFLLAMASDEGRPTLSSSVAERLTSKLSSIGPARASLISKGLIYAPQHGQVAYTVPGMSEYVRRQEQENSPQAQD